MKILSQSMVAALFLMASMAAQTFSGQLDNFFTVDEYLASHTGQLAVFERFRKRVRQPVGHSLNLKGLSVVIIYPGKQISDYWQRSARSFKKRLGEYGTGFKTHDYFMKPTASLRFQAKVLQDALAEKPDYIIFTLDAQRHQRMIEPVLARGKPKFILQNITTPLKQWEGRQPMIYIGFDHIIGSRMVAAYFLKTTRGQGTYAALLPRSGYLNTVRGGSFLDYMHQETSLEFIGAYHTGINEKKAYQAALEILNTHDKVSFIYAASTDIALGAARAVAEKKLTGKTLVNGWGGGSAELEALAAEEIDVTVMRMNDDNGVAMADAIALDFSGRGDEVPRIYSGDFSLVTKDTPPKKVAELKKKAFRYSD